MPALANLTQAAPENAGWTAVTTGIYTVSCDGVFNQGQLDSEAAQAALEADPTIIHKPRATKKPSVVFEYRASPAQTDATEFEAIATLYSKGEARNIQIADGEIRARIGGTVAADAVTNITPYLNNA